MVMIAASLLDPSAFSQNETLNSSPGMMLPKGPMFTKSVVPLKSKALSAAPVRSGAGKAPVTTPSKPLPVTSEPLPLVKG